NAVPNDPRPPAVTSGIRIGTAAVTTRGMAEDEFRRIAGWIDEAIQKRAEPSSLAKIRAQVADLCAAFPLYARRPA
ncbi:MAG TPA: serine hydroxymethyltransferase, partial [Candidatus Eisenbacteria bacterium]|nr:serine hydroxymethyltransferase [Candidatus Eisenbacteria bacterium]